MPRGPQGQDVLLVQGVKPNEVKGLGRGQDRRIGLKSRIRGKSGPEIAHGNGEQDLVELGIFVEKGLAVTAPLR